MINEKLTRKKKVQMVVFLIISLLLAVLFGSLTVLAPKGLPWFGRVGFGAGAVFSLTFVGMYGWILKKGSMNLKKDNVDLAWTGWGCVIVIGTIALVFSNKLPDPIKGVHWLVSALFFLIAAGVILLRAHIQRSEINTREKLLEIEYRLAELADKVTGERPQ
jgi:FtsH-binding integral membrane protein